MKKRILIVIKIEITMIIIVIVEIEMFIIIKKACMLQTISVLLSIWQSLQGSSLELIAEIMEAFMFISLSKDLILWCKSGKDTPDVLIMVLAENFQAKRSSLSAVNDNTSN